LRPCASCQHSQADQEDEIVEEPAVVTDARYRAETPNIAQVKLARAEAQLQAEREMRDRLEYILREEVAQELAGISLLVAALRRQAGSAGAMDLALQQIAALLTSSIGRCCVETRTPQRARR